MTFGVQVLGDIVPFEVLDLETFGGFEDRVPFEVRVLEVFAFVEDSARPGVRESLALGSSKLHNSHLSWVPEGILVVELLIVGLKIGTTGSSLVLKCW